MNLDPRQILEYVKESSELLAEMQEKQASLETEKAELTTKVQEGQAALAEKEAAEKAEAPEPTPVFTDEQVRPVMEKLAKAEKIKDVDAATERVVQDPTALLLALDKMAADAIVSVPSKIGGSVTSDNAPPAEERESDRQFETRFLNLSQKL